MEDTLRNLLTHPITIGLLVGLAVAVAVWVRGAMKVSSARSEGLGKIRALEAEIRKLQQHLHTQMEITAKGNEGVRDEITELKRQNLNLSSTIGALKSKPGRAELRTLHIYEKAIRLMHSRAPGFGSAWDSALEEAERETVKEESGILGWIRKPYLFSRRKSSGTGDKLLEDKD